MIKRNKILIFGILVSLIFSLSSCSSDDSEKVDIPFSADISNSVRGKKVAFQGVTNNAVSWMWDFGDGATSTEKNPVHTYAAAGYYEMSLTATSKDGTTITKERRIGIEITPYVLLTGGPLATNGKTWKLAGTHSTNDYFAEANAELTAFSDAPKPLPSGIFGGGLGMPEVYQDEYTFHYDGGYSMDLKDGAALSGLVYQFITTGGAGIKHPSSNQDFGLCTGNYTPEPDATFEFLEGTDLTIGSVYGPGGALTYSGVNILEFSGTMFVGVLDYERRAIVQELGENSMRVVMFLAASPEYAPLNTHALVLTFEAVQ